MPSRLGANDVVVDALRVATLLYPNDVATGVGTSHSAVTLNANIANVLDLNGQEIGADAALARGDIVVADVTPNYTLLNVGAANTVLFSDGTDPSWSLAATTVPLPPVAQGDIIIANGTPAWSVLTLGAQFTHLEAGAATATWEANITLADDSTVGLSGGGNLNLNSTTTPDTLNFASCQVGVNEAAPGGMAHVTASGAAVIGLIVEGASGQSEDLQQWNSSAATLARFNEIGQLGIGADPNAYLDVAHTYTDLAGTLNLIDVLQTINPGGASAATFRGMLMQLDTAGANDISLMEAFRGIVSHFGTGTVSSAFGLEFEARNFSTGTINNLTPLFIKTTNNNAGGAIGIARGLRIDVTNVGTITSLDGVRISTPTNTGTITTNIGLNILDQDTATNDWAIVTNAGRVVLNEGGDASTDIRFESNNFTHMFFVDAGFDSVLINSSADLSSTFGVVATAAADIGVVIRAFNASQSGALLQLQGSGGAIFFTSGDGLTASEVVWNDQGVDIDFVIEAVGVADAFVVDGAAGQITLGALTAGSVQSSAGGVLSVVDPAITYPVAPVAQGDMLVADAIPAWTILTLGAAAGYALVSTATTAVWDQTPSWTGDHTWTSTASTKPILTLENTNADAAAPTVGFYKNTASPLDGDDLGEINFFGETSTGAKDRYALIRAESLDVTNADTGGGIDFVVVMDASERSLLKIVGYNGAVNQGEVIVNQDGQDVDFRVEASGVADALQVLGSSGEITLGALGAGVVQSTAGGVLSSAAVPLVDIAGYAQGSIIIGGAADWEALAHPGAAGYALISDATELVWDLTPNWLGDHTWTSATATKPILTLENTNADGNSPQIDFYKNTASPLDGDNLSLLQFFGETSTGAKERYAFMVVESLDVTNADTGGGFRFEVVMNAVERNLFEITGYNGAVNQGEVIVNQDGQDVDFRVEGSTDVNLLTIEAATDAALISGTTQDTNLTAPFQVFGGIVGTVESAVAPITLVTYGVSGATNFPALRGRAARGTRATPTAVQNNDVLVRIGGAGYGTTGFATTNRAYIQMEATQTWTDANQGAEINFYTTPDGSAIPTLRGTIQQDGDWIIGNLATTASQLHVYDLSTSIQVTLETDLVNGQAVIQYINDARTWSAGINTSDQFQIRDGTAAANRLLINTSGHVIPGANKTQDLGLTGTRWNTLFQGTSTAAGTSRTFASTRNCPVCQVQMIRGTGSLCILGEDRDYEVAMCPNCGTLATEEMKHLPPARLTERRPAPKIELLGVHVFEMSGNSRKVRVDFCYNNDVTNATYLGETELADLLMMSEPQRQAFLLELGQREWDAMEEIRLQKEEVAALQGTLDTLVAPLVGTNLLRNTK